MNRFEGTFAFSFMVFCSNFKITSNAINFQSFAFQQRLNDFGSLFFCSKPKRLVAWLTFSQHKKLINFFSCFAFDRSACGQHRNDAGQHFRSAACSLCRPEWSASTSAESALVPQLTALCFDTCPLLFGRSCGGRTRSADRTRHSSVAQHDRLDQQLFLLRLQRSESIRAHLFAQTT